MPPLGGQTGNIHRNTRRVLQAHVYAASPVPQPQTSAKDANGNGSNATELLRYITPASHARTVSDLGKGCEASGAPGAAWCVDLCAVGRGSHALAAPAPLPTAPLPLLSLGDPLHGHAPPAPCSPVSGFPGAHAVSCPDGTALNGFRAVVVQDPEAAAANGTTQGADGPSTPNRVVAVEYSCLRVPLTANCSAAAARIYHSGTAVNARFPVTSNLALADLL